METYPPRVRRDPGVGLRGNHRRALAPGAQADQQIIQWGWGFHTPWGGIDPEDLRLRSWTVGVVEIWKDFRPGDRNLSFTGAAGPPLSPRVGSRRPSNHPVGLRFLHPAAGFRPGGSAFTSPGCWNGTDMEGFPIRRWKRLLECGGTAASARGATLAARWIQEPQPISNHLLRSK